MKCKNCGKENPENEKYCSNCKMPLNEKSGSYDLKWNSIVIGVVAAVILLGVSYILFGSSNTFFFGMIVAAFIGGCFTCVSAYNKDIKAADDINPLFNGIIAGLIIGFPVIFLGPSLVILIPGYVVFAFLGGALGFLINFLRQKNTLWVIPLLAVIIIVVSFAGYSYNQTANNAYYYESYGESMVSMGLADVVQLDAEILLNEPVNTTSQRIENLRVAEKKYQRMKYLMEIPIKETDEMENLASTELKKEFVMAFKEYISLKTNYYNEMELAINLTINRNEREAQIHFKNAENLRLQIKNQENLLTTIANKDPQFKQYIDKQKRSAETAVNYFKSQNMTITLD